jgi:putative ABC transport system substrate-binding protein
VTDREEIVKALEATSPAAVDAIFHIPSNLVRVNLDLLVKKAKTDRIPLAVNQDTFLDLGALISYGPNLRLVGIQAANHVNKILKGSRPGEIMVENPERFFLGINQNVAKQIGMRIPSQVLERADRLVQ